MIVEGYGVCPSVSTVLKGVGLDQLPVIPMKGVPVEQQALASMTIMNQAAHKGILVHSATEVLDCGGPRFDIGDPELEPFVESWIGFKKEYGFAPAEANVETRFGMTAEEAKLLRFCGIIDRHGRLNGDGDYILEIKRTSTLPLKTIFQLTAYRSAMLRLKRYENLHIGAVVLNAKGKPGRLSTWTKEEEDNADYMWNAALAITNWRYDHELN